MKSKFCRRVVVAALILFGGWAHAADVGYTDNLVIVLDVSGSMKGDKIERAKAAVSSQIQTLPEQMEVGLLTFSSNNQWVVPLAPLQRPAFIAKVNKITAGGDTYLGEAIKVGADSLLAKREKQFGRGSYRLLVLTDGRANDQDKVERFTPQILARGIRLDCIGVEMPGDHVLTTMAHSYRNVADASKLAEAVKEVMAEAGQERDDMGNTAFDVIAPMPAEMAAAIIAAFTESESDNTPIGEKAKPAVQVRVGTDGSPDPPDDEVNWLLIFAGVFATILLLILLVRWATS
jgi:uncharacterized protein YegL